MNEQIMNLSDFSLTKTEIENTADVIASEAIAQNKTAELLWKLKVMEDLVDLVKGKIYDHAVKSIQVQLQAETGTITVGKCDINIQIPNETKVECKKIEDYNNDINVAKAHIKAITEMAKGIEKPMKHPLYGLVHPATYVRGKAKFVVKPHRI